ncbi:hypothetical protein PCASD_20616 [Puccinia coronata f. sp. avenae]|uniref:Uncharacterized protein n=1 Tax=Puccinia coronata f. sp. avenae TaxID=200324 RepID=A0A2N5U191_9BASI|nr:hypothetical protein PCASD_20616 [Puccinia coronata f. sp. avenae]
MGELARVELGPNEPKQFIYSGQKASSKKLDGCSGQGVPNGLVRGDLQVGHTRFDQGIGAGAMSFPLEPQWPEWSARWSEQFAHRFKQSAHRSEQSSHRSEQSACRSKQSARRSEHSARWSEQSAHRSEQSACKD